jgi:uncharacterized membrane protein
MVGEDDGLAAAEVGAMESVTKSIDVDVPVATAYDQWTRFEEFPRFMEGVREVRHLDEQRLFWRARIAGKDVEWTAEITEQAADRVVAWRSTSGAPNAGEVRFEPLDAARTRVHLRLSYLPRSAEEKLADLAGVVRARVEGDLRRFKEFVESGSRQTGGWRGEVNTEKAPR